MRCNYNLDTQQSAITSTTTMDQGGRLGGGWVFLSLRSVYISVGNRGAAGMGAGGLYLSYTQYSFIYFLFLSTYLLSGTLFFLSCAFLRCC